MQSWITRFNLLFGNIHYETYVCVLPSMYAISSSYWQQFSKSWLNAVISSSMKWHLLSLWYHKKKTVKECRLSCLMVHPPLLVMCVTTQTHDRLDARDRKHDDDKDHNKFDSTLSNIHQRWVFPRRLWRKNVKICWPAMLFLKTSSSFSLISFPNNDQYLLSLHTFSETKRDTEQSFWRHISLSVREDLQDVGQYSMSSPRQ